MSKKKFRALYKVPDDHTDVDYLHKENIVNAAAEIIKTYTEYTEVVLIAEMQSGKSEVMRRLVYVIQQFNSKLRNLGIDIDRTNIYVVLSTSSIDLKQQLKNKIPEISHHIYHLPDINKWTKNLYEFESIFLSMSESSLVIIDESHCDAEVGHIMDKFRTTLHSMSAQNSTTFYTLSVSASPYEQVKANYPKVIMQPGDGYYGLKEMFFSKIPVIYQAKKLSDSVECAELFEEINICDYYYIFRLSDRKESADQMMSNLENEFRKRGVGIDTMIYDMTYRENINDYIQTKPTKPTLIYLKDKLRMGEYLNTEHVYLVHDDPSNMYTHTTIQSLVGRCCGYGKKSNFTLIYCDVAKAFQHYKWIKHGYNKKHIPTDSKYISKRSKKIKELCIY